MGPINVKNHKIIYLGHIQNQPTLFKIAFINVLKIVTSCSFLGFSIVKDEFQFFFML